jgi:predicted dehydrogenase
MLDLTTARHRTLNEKRSEKTVPTGFDCNQSWPRPSRPRPIVIVGAGGIVDDAHLPAYFKADLPVHAVYDIDADRADTISAKWQIPHIYSSLSEAASAAASENCIFDVAVPPEQLFAVVSALPDRSTVLMQKPMGMDLVDARRIREVCRAKRLTAAVNFQLRFAPAMLALKDLVARGALGQLVDVEFHFHLRTPWEQFPYLKELSRCEIQVHTVHHLDLCRHLLGDPRGAYARTLSHPHFTDLANTKTAAILDYGPMTRCVLSINHDYEFGPEYSCADVSVQGTEGALRVSLGLLLDYPNGRPETFHIAWRGLPWCEVPLEGRWFPDAYIGTMSNLQRFAAWEDDVLVSHYEDAYRTMALVEACYISDASGATPIPE